MAKLMRFIIWLAGLSLCVNRINSSFFSVKRMVKIKGEYSIREFLKMEEVLAESVCS